MDSRKQRSSYHLGVKEHSKNSFVSFKDYSGAMDLFGDIDDISSESDGDNQPPIPGKPVVSTVTNHNWPHCSKLRKKFQRLMGLTRSCREDMDNELSETFDE